MTTTLAANLERLTRLQDAGRGATAVIGSSDFHYVAPLGRRRTVLLVAEVGDHRAALLAGLAAWLFVFVLVLRSPGPDGPASAVGRSMS